MTTKIYRNFSEIATLQTASRKDGRYLRPDDLDLIKNGTVVFHNKLFKDGIFDVTLVVFIWFYQPFYAVE